MYKEYPKSGNGVKNSGTKAYSPKSSDVKSASNGENGGNGGSGSRYPNAVSGKRFAPPAAQANASNGAMTGGPAGRTSYPATRPSSKVRPNAVTNETGTGKFVPKPGDAKKL